MIDLPDEEYRDSNECLPAWFVGRMMDDDWQFGLLLSSGIVLAISRIDKVRKDAGGNIWIDVDLLDAGQSIQCQTYSELRFIQAQCDRTRASVNASHVVAAFELADT